MLALVPKSFAVRCMVIAWLVACVSMLAFAYVRQDIHDMPVAFTLIMVGLSFPSGLLGVVLVGLAWPFLSTALGVTYQPFLDLLPYWFISVGLGYLQWFVVLPWVLGRVLRAKSSA